MIGTSRKSALALRLALGASMAALAASTGANAQSAAPAVALAAPATELEQVVVTAQKSSSKLQSTPLSITAVDAKVLDKSNITNFVQLDGRVPGLVVNATGVNAPTITIRGVGFEGYQNDSGQPGVSFSENGVYIASPMSLQTAFLDIDQVEVIRGPQGTVLGQNSDGGALNVTTTAPRLGDYEGAAEVSYGSYNFLRSRIIANLPVGDTFAIRAAVQQESHDGWSKATKIPGKPDFALDNENSYSGRLNLLWKPTDRLSVNVWGEAYSNNAHASGAKNILDPDPNPRHVSSDYAGYVSDHTYVAAGTIAYDFGWATLKSISSYQSTVHRSPEDVDLLDFNTAIALYGVHDRAPYYYRHPTAVTTEIDLVSPTGGKLDWIVGAFYLHQSSDQAFIEYQQTSPGMPLPVYLHPTGAQLGQIFGNQLSFESQSVEKHTAYSVYGQGVYHLTPSLRITAGARYSWDTSTGDVATYYGAPVHLETAFSALTGKVGIDYEIAPENMIYATFSDGVKPGGTNLNPFSTQIPSVFKHETVDELEIGTKNQFFDRRLRVNIAAFYNDYRNMQVDSEDPLPYQGGVTNIGRLHTYGVEADVSALLPYSFRVDANLAAMDGKVDSHTHLIDPVAAQEANRLYGVFTPADLAARAAAEVDIHGRTPGKLPPFSASLAISRTDDMPFGGTLESRLQVLYRAAYYFRVYNIPAYDKVPDMHQLDLSFRYQPQNPHWYAELLVVNLTDSNSVNARIADNFGVGEVANLYVPPRQIIGRLGVRF